MRWDWWVPSYLLQKMLEALELGGGRQPLLEEAVPVRPRIFLGERPLRPVVRVEGPGWKVKQGRVCGRGGGSSTNQPPQMPREAGLLNTGGASRRGEGEGRSLQQLEREGWRRLADGTAEFREVWAGGEGPGTETLSKETPP